MIEDRIAYYRGKLGEWKGLRKVAERERNSSLVAACEANINYFRQALADETAALSR